MLQTWKLPDRFRFIITVLLEDNFTVLFMLNSLTWSRSIKIFDADGKSRMWLS